MAEPLPPLKLHIPAIGSWWEIEAVLKTQATSTRREVVEWVWPEVQMLMDYAKQRGKGVGTTTDDEMDGLADDAIRHLTDTLCQVKENADG